MKLQKFNEWYMLREMGAGVGSPAVGREKIKMDGSPCGAQPNGKPYALSSVGTPAPPRGLPRSLGKKK